MSGLSAGIYSCMSGYETVIYEKNAVAGGNCSGWKRGDYYIDNCLHWLTGSREGSGQNKIWREIGALDDNVALIKRDMFYSTEKDGVTVTLWRDISRTQRELISLSPEDEKEITHFLDAVRVGVSFTEPASDAATFIKAIKAADITTPASDMMMAIIGYLGMSTSELAERFKHPAIKTLILDFMAKEYEAYWLIMAYGFFVSENGDLPEGGSVGLVKRIQDKYLSLGGKLILGTPVKNVSIVKTPKADLNEIRKEFIAEIDNDLPANMSAAKYISGYLRLLRDTGSVVVKETGKSIKHIYKRMTNGIYLENGSFVPADYVICACDMNYVFSDLVNNKYVPKPIKKELKGNSKNTIYSSFQVAFSVDGEMEEVPDTLGIDCEPFDVARHTFSRFNIKNYRLYGDYIAPKGSTVIQVSITQYKDDFKFWKTIYKDKSRYRQVKINIAWAIMERIVARFPQYEGKIHILDTWTPITYSRRNNCYYGAYMRFITTLTRSGAYISDSMFLVNNIYLAGQWLIYPGGLPMSAFTGKMAIKSINRREKNDALEPKQPDVELGTVSLK